MTTKKPQGRWESQEAPPDRVPQPPPGLVQSLMPQPVRWVTIHLKLITWNYLNFVIRVPVSLSVTAVHDRIVEHHNGAISKIELWRDQPHPSNVIRDLSQSLETLFGFADDAPQRDLEGTIWYQFAPLKSECPLLLRSPRLAGSQQTHQLPQQVAQGTTGAPPSSAVTPPKVPR
eukprot:TRINITY_DN21734_c0_g1_i1.p1 TRINITY_DN21734_c0_g1~~TRINITY_DN21734_c0_g1_i1.p1  ORF type:complete len:204 (-),score=8.85 TRINITY_DN21734_c0_g1_i1:726-1247(-)